MKVARLIITLDCNRSCHYCCNKYKTIIDSAIQIKDLSKLNNFNQICITGGEPSLDPKRTTNIIDLLQCKNRTIYLYTAMYSLYLFKLYLNNKLDGIHYTLHESSTENDIGLFYTMQGLAEEFPRSKSNRLYIHRSINKRISIIPCAWKRVETKDWISEDTCKLPENETLFILDEDYERSTTRTIKRY